MYMLALIVSALVLLSAIGAMGWTWRTMRRAEDDLRVEAYLRSTDFDVGAQPLSTRTSAG